MKKYSRSYNYGKRINPVSIGISLVIAFIWCTSGEYDDTYVADHKEDNVFMKPVVVENIQDESVETKIRKYFPKNADVMVAIAKAESGMNMNAKGYNCYYSKGVATTTKIVGGSKACLVKDRSLAWSVDCYILQDNRGKGSKDCPSITVDEHLAKMAALSKICGLDCWWAYKDKKHLAYMK